jgi:uncharacterized protein (DUF58 family)
MSTAPDLQPPPVATTRRARRTQASPAKVKTPPDPDQPGVATRLTRSGAGLWSGLRAKLAEWRALAEPVLTPVRRVLVCVSPLGWLTLAAAGFAWLVAAALGWQEFAYAAAALLFVFALSCLLTIGRMSLEVTTRVEPQRVVAGDASAIEVTVRNVGKAPMLPVPLDLPTGDTVTRFGLPALGAGSEFSDVVVMPSQKRGLYVIGPASTLRGDPFGLVRREVTWTEPAELFVHPRTIYLEPLGSGMLKDLEGRSTNDMSMSDLAFHTLREYAPGDDRRHIHWLSSAKRSGAGGSEEFMVRQFLDTRRSHIGVVVDCHTESWMSEDEFETAVSGGASVIARAMRDGQDVSEATGPYVLTRPKRHTALDLFSRARLGEETLEATVSQLTRVAPNVSAVLLFVGPLTPLVSIRRAAALFGPDVNVVAVRIEHGASIGLQRSGGRSIVTIGSLADLPRALAGKVAG